MGGGSIPQRHRPCRCQARRPRAGAGEDDTKSWYDPLTTDWPVPSNNPLFNPHVFPRAAAPPDKTFRVGQHVPGTTVTEPAPHVRSDRTRSAQELGAVQHTDFKPHSRHSDVKFHNSDPDPGIAILRPTAAAFRPGLQQGADAPRGSHPPCASQPCAREADPVLRPLEGSRGESVGHWIDAALADEGWWGAQWRICIGAAAN
jgi:hypothetical protein